MSDCQRECRAGMAWCWWLILTRTAVVGLRATIRGLATRNPGLNIMAFDYLRPSEMNIHVPFFGHVQK